MSATATAVRGDVTSIEGVTFDRSIYIAVGPYVWGKGFTQGQARAACRAANGGKNPDHTIVYECNDAWAVIDDYGRICFAQDKAYREVARYGFKKHVEAQ